MIMSDVCQISICTTAHPYNQGRILIASTNATIAADAINSPVHASNQQFIPPPLCPPLSLDSFLSIPSVLCV